MEDIGGAVVDNVIVGTVNNLLSLGTQVMNFIMSNEYLLVLFCGSLVGVACYVLRKVKRTARH